MPFAILVLLIRALAKLPPPSILPNELPQKECSSLLHPNLSLFPLLSSTILCPIVCHKPNRISTDVCIFCTKREPEGSSESHLWEAEATPLTSEQNFSCWAWAYICAASMLAGHSAFQRAYRCFVWHPSEVLYELPWVLLPDQQTWPTMACPLASISGSALTLPLGTRAGLEIPLGSAGPSPLNTHL